MQFRSFSPLLSVLIVSFALLLAGPLVVYAQDVNFTKLGAHVARSPRVGFHKPQARHYVARSDEPSLDNRAAQVRPDWRRDPVQFTRPDWRRDLGQIEKRVENARLTLYNAGLGACGARNNNNDAIVAMSAKDWDGGAHCFKDPLACQGFLVCENEAHYLLALLFV